MAKKYFFKNGQFESGGENNLTDDSVYFPGKVTTTFSPNGDDLSVTNATMTNATITSVSAPTGRTATYVIAASDAPTSWLAQSDKKMNNYTSDDLSVVVEAAWALGYDVLLSPGHFYAATQCDGVANHTIKGSGKWSTIIQYPETLGTVFSFSGVNYTGISELEITKNTTDGGGTTGIIVVNNNSQYYNINNIAIYDTGNTSIGIILDSCSSQDSLNFIDHCNFYNISQAINVGTNAAVSYVTIANNQIYTTYSYGMFLNYCADLTVRDNEIFAAGKTTYGGVYISSGCKYLIFTHNKIIHSGSGARSAYGVRFVANVVGLIFQGNSIISNGGPGVQDDMSGNCTLNIVGNYIYNNGTYTSGTTKNRSNILVGDTSGGVNHYCNIINNCLGGDSTDTPAQDIYCNYGAKVLNIENNYHDNPTVATTFITLYANSANQITNYRNNQPYIGTGEIRTYSRTITSASDHHGAIISSIDNPFGQAVKVINVEVNLTTQAGAAATLDIGVGSSATADYATMIAALPLNPGTSYPYFYSAVRTATYGQMAAVAGINWATGGGNRYLNFFNPSGASDNGAVWTYTVTCMGN